jgi:hypothetical protein
MPSRYPFLPILIDMQDIYLNLLSRDKRQEIISSQIDVIRFCAEMHIPLTLLEFEWEGPTIPSIRGEAKKVRERTLFRKNSNDGFDYPPFEEHIHSLAFEGCILLLMGLNGCYCVLTTGKSAIKRGYRIATARNLIGGTYSHSKDNCGDWYRNSGIYEADHISLLDSLINDYK